MVKIPQNMPILTAQTFQFHQMPIKPAMAKSGRINSIEVMMPRVLEDDGALHDQQVKTAFIPDAAPANPFDEENHGNDQACYQDQAKRSYHDACGYIQLIEHHADIFIAFCLSDIGQCRVADSKCAHPCQHRDGDDNQEDSPKLPVLPGLGDDPGDEHDQQEDQQFSGEDIRGGFVAKVQGSDDRDEEKRALTTIFQITQDTPDERHPPEDNVDLIACVAAVEGYEGGDREQEPCHQRPSFA